MNNDNQTKKRKRGFIMIGVMIGAVILLPIIREDVGVGNLFLVVAGIACISVGLRKKGWI